MGQVNKESEGGRPSEEHSDDPQREAYLEERKMLIEAEGEAAQSFDKALTTLSAGAFGLSLAFIRFIAPAPQAVGWLYVAWSGLVLSLLSVLLSFLMSQYAFRRQRDILDADYIAEEQADEQESNGWAIATGRLNLLSIVSFVVGVVALAYFAIRNLA